MSATEWYGLVGHEVVGPFDVLDQWYHEHAGPDWRHKVIRAGGDDPWRVARDEVGDREVSTVFLGLDHQWIEGGPPHLFETMIFPDDEQWRCSTWEQAECQHAHAMGYAQGLANSGELGDRLREFP